MLLSQAQSSKLGTPPKRFSMKSMSRDVQFLERSGIALHGSQSEHLKPQIKYMDTFKDSAHKECFAQFIL